MDCGRRSSPVGRHENPRERGEIVSINAGSGAVSPQESSMHMNLTLAPLVALIAGVLILIMPRLLNYIVAIYLILTGLLGLFGGAGSFHLR
jgi:hypothetical protein